MSTKHDVDPPNAQRVARRAMVLSAVVCRSCSDHDPDDPDAQDLWQRLKDWIESLDVDTEIESHERQLIHAPLGSLSEKDRIAGTWRVEGLAILAWSLGLLSFPPHDEKVDAYEVTDATAILNPEAAEIVESANLRPHSELSACRELL